MTFSFFHSIRVIAMERGSAVSSMAILEMCLFDQFHDGLLPVFQGGPYQVEAIARCLLPDILAFFESEEGQREFAQWKKEQEEKKKEKE